MESEQMRFRIADFGVNLQFFNPQSEIRNPKSHLLWFHRSSICSISRFAAPRASRGE